MAWPAVSDFNDVVQNPGRCFEDQELGSGNLATNSRGLPLVYSGNFASVYKISSGSREFAVRCFTREVKDQQQRYSHLDEYLKGARPDCFVRFEYLDRGILVRGQWYPIVKMAWVDGQRLDKFVESHRYSSDILKEMAARWRGANGSLRGLNIAHNDLQHGNVMVQQGEAIRLVDYDGIFLPKFQGEVSPELGHKNYQHPMRSVRDYDEHIDNFPSLVVYLSLLAISAKPELFERFYNQENLIFTKRDFEDPNSSECFKELKSIREANVGELAVYLGDLCSRPVELVPDLESILQGGPSAAAPTSSTPVSVASTVPATPPPPAVSHTPTPAPKSEFKKLILANQIPALDPVIISPPLPMNPVIACPQCNEANSTEFIYCANESCLNVIQPGSHYCYACNGLVPVNACFCPNCRYKSNVPGKA